MAYMRWLPEYEIGIPVIDEQHRRIVDFINRLENAHAVGNAARTADTLDGLLDYTMTHFRFEENLQARAGYPFVKAHRHVHEIFIRRVMSFRERFERGENVANELLFMLRTWLSSHIKGDDRDYGEVVRKAMHGKDWVDGSVEFRA